MDNIYDLEKCAFAQGGIHKRVVIRWWICTDCSFMFIFLYNFFNVIYSQSYLLNISFQYTKQLKVNKILIIYCSFVVFLNKVVALIFHMYFLRLRFWNIFPFITASFLGPNNELESAFCSIILITKESVP